MAIDHAGYERLLQHKISQVEHALTTRETLHTAMGQNGNVVSLRCKAVARDSVVVNDGRAEFA